MPFTPKSIIHLYIFFVIVKEIFLFFLLWIVSFAMCWIGPSFLGIVTVSYYCCNSHCQLSGLKHNTLIILQLQRSEVWNGYDGLQLGVGKGAVLWRLQGSICSLTFSVSRSCPYSLAPGWPLPKWNCTTATSDSAASFLTLCGGCAQLDHPGSSVHLRTPNPITIAVSLLQTNIFAFPSCDFPAIQPQLQFSIGSHSSEF